MHTKGHWPAKVKSGELKMAASHSNIFSSACRCSKDGFPAIVRRYKCGLQITKNSLQFTESRLHYSSSSSSYACLGPFLTFKLTPSKTRLIRYINLMEINRGKISLDFSRLLGTSGSTSQTDRILTQNLWKKQMSSNGCKNAHKHDVETNLFCFSRSELRTDDKSEEFENLVKKNAIVIENFISKDDEARITKEVEKSLARQKYQYDHWDGVIYGYREIEKSRWTPENHEILERIRKFAFDESAIMLPAVHVLDLAKEGYIKPHVDSKFCGPTIAGLSLLSTSVMRLKQKDDVNSFVDILLRPRTLYVMRGRVRYELTHEILPEKDSRWKNEVIPRERRISVMLREEPAVS